MKASVILNFVAIVVFCCSGTAFSGQGSWKAGLEKGNRDKSQYHQRHQSTEGRSDHRRHGDNIKEHDTPRHGSHNTHHDYHKHSGYRERPYGKGRHYGHFVHKGHRYDYRGHWRSWDQWNRYAKEHPGINQHGSYYRDEEAHLMFRFRDPVTGGYFFFSIGR
jgi:hypothetical protein